MATADQGGRVTARYGRLQPLLVGLEVRQALTPTARAQAALPRLAGGVTPTWAAVLGDRLSAHPAPGRT